MYVKQTMSVKENKMSETSTHDSLDNGIGFVLGNTKCDLYHCSLINCTGCSCERYISQDVNNCGISCCKERCNFTNNAKIMTHRSPENVPSHTGFSEYEEITGMKDSQSEIKFGIDYSGMNHVSIFCQFCKRQIESERLLGLHYNIYSDELCDKYEDFCPSECGIRNRVILKEHIQICPKLNWGFSTLDLIVNKKLPILDNEINGENNVINLLKDKVHVLFEEINSLKLINKQLFDEVKEIKELSINSTNLKDLENKFNLFRADIRNSESSQNKKLNVLEAKYGNFCQSITEMKEIMKQLKEEIFKNIETVKTRVDDERKELINEIENLKKSINSVHEKEEKQYVKETTFPWEIKNYNEYLLQAKIRKDQKLTSQYFDVPGNDWKVAFDLYPNGFGTDFGKFVSVILNIKKCRQTLKVFNYNFVISFTNQSKNHLVKLAPKVCDGDVTSVTVYKLMKVDDCILVDDSSLRLAFTLQKSN